MDNYTPRQIVDELNKYIIGQKEAKKNVAVALRNRYRRSLLPAELQEEITPKNIILIGPTGVGKTEIARRLARLVKAPFLKVEVTKFTEVGYVGRDVESMIRDLVEISIMLEKNEGIQKVKGRAQEIAEERILNYFAPYPQKNKPASNPLEFIFGSSVNNSSNEEYEDRHQEDLRMAQEKRAIYKQKLQRLELEDEIIEIELIDNSPSMLEVFSGSGMDEMGINVQELLGGMLPKKKKKRRLKVKEARKHLIQEEADKLLDMDAISVKAIDRVEQKGIIFLDEIDKIAKKEGAYGPDISRGGVQRDILPIVEGATVMTKYGPVKTDHILFIAAGAFHVSKPSDLIPELQGRFPIRVELQSLTQDDFKEILTKPRNSLVRQYVALLKTENIEVIFSEDAIAEIAKIAYDVNTRTENIGARRLHTILEKLLQELLFHAPELDEKTVNIDANYVREQLDSIVEHEDLSKYIL